MSNTTNTSKTVTLNVDASWQPTTEQTGHTAEFAAFQRQFAVTSPMGVTFHGNWRNLAAAERFARSMGSKGGAAAVASEVTPYWYAPAFGVVG